MRTARTICLIKLGLLLLAPALAAETNEMPNGYLFLGDGSFLGVYLDDQKIQMGDDRPPVAWKEIASFTNQSGVLKVKQGDDPAAIDVPAPATLSARTSLGKMTFSIQQISHYGPIAEAMLRENRLFIPPAPTKHTCVEGDTIRSIAKQYGITVQRLYEINPRLTNQGVTPGQTLKLGVVTTRTQSRFF